MSAARDTLAALAEEYLRDDIIWPLGSSSRIRPAVMGFVKWLQARGVSSLRAPQSGPWRVEYNTKLPGSSWWVTDRFGAQPSGSVWSFDSEVQARAVCDALNTVAGSGAETPPQPETK